MVVLAGARVVHGLAARVEEKAAKDGKQPGKLFNKQNAREDEDGAQDNGPQDAPGEHLAEEGGGGQGHGGEAGEADT